MNIVITPNAMEYIKKHSKSNEIILWKRSISGCFLAYDELVVSIKRELMNFNFDELIQITVSGVNVFIHPDAFEFIKDMNEIIIDFKDDKFFPSLYVLGVEPITHETTC